jgi:hypothetical protein
MGYLRVKLPGYRRNLHSRDVPGVCFVLDSVQELTMLQPQEPHSYRIKVFGSFWCRLMHDALMWPFRGHYRCRICNRSYTVPWGA